MSTKADRDRIELLQGTLDLLILKTLRLGPAHGHAIAKAIEQGSDEVLRVEQRTTGLPFDFPLKSTETTLEYGLIKIEQHTYLPIVHWLPERF